MSMTTKPLAERDALLLENLRLQAQVQQYLAQVMVLEAQKEVDRLQALYEVTKREIEQGQDVMGWTLELEQRVWVKPDIAEERIVNGHDTHHQL